MKNDLVVDIRCSKKKIVNLFQKSTNNRFLHIEIPKFHNYFQHQNRGSVSGSLTFLKICSFQAIDDAICSYEDFTVLS